MLFTLAAGRDLALRAGAWRLRAQRSVHCDCTPAAAPEPFPRKRSALAISTTRSLCQMQTIRGQSSETLQVLAPCRTEILEATGFAAAERLLAAVRDPEHASQPMVYTEEPGRIEELSEDRAQLLRSSSCALWILNRPAALNALNLPMVQALRRRYLQYAIAKRSSMPATDGKMPHPACTVLFTASVACASLFPRSWQLVPASDAKCWLVQTTEPSPRSSSRVPFFCSGGDIREMYRHGLPDGDRRIQRIYFQEEYRLNYLLAGGLWEEKNMAITQEPLVQISLLDGIVMGGGVGLSIHGRFRVATENTIFAMPECGIGFHPDVGASWVLPRLLDWKREGCPGSRLSMERIPSTESAAVGTWLAVTGARVRGIDAVRLGIATHYCPSHRIHELVSRVAELAHHMHSREGASISAAALDELDTALQSFQPDVDTSWTAFGHERVATITELFDPKHGKRELRDLWSALQAAKNDPRKASFAQDCLASMERCSPLSMLVAYESVGVRGSTATTLADCLRREFVTTLRCLDHPDFMEGVRAQLVDKDRNPRWHSAPSLNAWFAAHDDTYTNNVVEKFFMPGADEHPLELDTWSLERNQYQGDSPAQRTTSAVSEPARTLKGSAGGKLPHSSL